ncbi:MAG: FkbM family methyltransferase [Chlamydiales bacterium]|nr:FkbM family methyltransferase [Chlamydiales bacterium]
MRNVLIGLLSFLSVTSMHADMAKSSEYGDVPVCGYYDSKIIGSGCLEMIELIDQFPYGNYSIFDVREHGQFYLDPINDFVKNHLRRGGSWEPFIRVIIDSEAAPGSTALDLGAHIGLHTIVMSRAVGPNGRVIAFEPQPKIFRELFMNMALNQVSNVHFFWAAAGASVGKIELTPLPLTGAVEVNEAGTAINGGSGKFVDLLTIDSLNLNNVSLIKMDVEGQENAVLDGARATILRNKPVIIIEIMGGTNFDTAPKHIRKMITATIRKLKSFGCTVERLRGHDYIAFFPKDAPRILPLIAKSKSLPDW